MKKLVLLFTCILFIVGCSKMTVNKDDPELITITSADIVKKDANPFNLKEYVEREQTYSIMYYEYPSGKLAGWRNKKTGKCTDSNLRVIVEGTTETTSPKQDFSRSSTTKDGKSSEPSPSQPKEEKKVLVELTTDPQKRLLEIDLLNTLRKDNNPAFIFDDKATDKKMEKNRVTVVVKELLYNEKEGSETRETVVLPHNKVSFAVNAFLMPNNASVLMDISKQTNVLEYAYEIEVRRLNKILGNDILRNRIETIGESCSNFRVRNVFGGEKALQVYPSEEVKSLCLGAPDLKSMSQLRQMVITEIRKSITSLLAKTN